LTNIARHAEAQTASIFIECKPEKVLAIIEDDGKGFDIDAVQQQEGHLGIYGIRERVALLSGSVEIESTIGLGTSLFVEIPLQPTEASLELQGA